MQNSIKELYVENINVVKGAWRVSKIGTRERLRYGLFELIPNLVFYVAHSIVVMVMFHNIHGIHIDEKYLFFFLLVMFCVDSIGDSLIFKGLNEYIRSLRRGETLHYLLTPGAPFLKVLCFRWDLPMIIFGAVCGMVAVLMGGTWFNQSPVTIFLCIVVGILAHAVLTSAFLIIQSYFDPTMPLPLGSPATRFYTKPLHLFLNSGIAIGVLSFFYPAYLITALPAGLGSNYLSGHGLLNPAFLYFGGLVSLGIWVVSLNILIVKSCRKW